MKYRLFTSALATSLVMASVAVAQTFNGTGGAIPDDGNSVDFVINVSGLVPSTLDTAAFGLESVCINATHTWDSDLDLTLIAPDGTQILLVSGCGGGGDNFTNTCFNGNASNSIASGSAPFTGTFRPMGWMGNINNGQNGNGTWTLHIMDTWPFADVGTLIGWNITFGNNPSPMFLFTFSEIPIIEINTGGLSIQDEPKIDVIMDITYNGAGAITYTSDPPNIYSGHAGIEIRGAYSSSLPQKPYGFETRDVLGAEMNTPLFFMPNEHDWCLIANYNDKSFVRNTLSYHLFRQMGHWSPRTIHCELLLNSDYRGIYFLCEKIKRDANRIPVATLDSAENSGDALTGGYIFKQDYYDGSNSWMSNFSPWGYPSKDVYFVYEYPRPENITLIQKTYIQAYVDSFETVLYSPAYADTATGYRKFIDVPSFIDYFIVEELARNVDSYRKSNLYYKEKNSDGGKIFAGPVWDMDWAWKNIQEGCPLFNATNGSGWTYLMNDCNYWPVSAAWNVRLLQDTLYANQLRCRWEELRNTILDTVYLFNYIDSVAGVLSQAQQRHYTLWPILGQATGAPEVDPPAQTFAEEISRLKNWIALRVGWMDDNIPGYCAPDLSGLFDAARSEDAVSLYPNPASDFIMIEMTTNSYPCRLIISDVTGKVFLEQTIENEQRNTTRIDVSGLPAGLYCCTVFSEQTTKSIIFSVIQ